jgi:hypothetical protein
MIQQVCKTMENVGQELKELVGMITKDMVK